MKNYQPAKDLTAFSNRELLLNVLNTEDLYIIYKAAIVAEDFDIIENVVSSRFLYTEAQAETLSDDWSAESELYLEGNSTLIS